MPSYCGSQYILLISLLLKKAAPQKLDFIPNLWGVFILE